MFSNILESCFMITKTVLQKAYNYRRPFEEGFFCVTYFIFRSSKRTFERIFQEYITIINQYKLTDHLRLRILVKLSQMKNKDYFSDVQFKIFYI